MPPKSITLLLLLISLTALACNRTLHKTQLKPIAFSNTVKDARDNKVYGIVQIGNLWWFAENLNYKSEKSTCYKKKEKYCDQNGRLYPNDELTSICPEGWRVPKLSDWQELKSNFKSDSIYALLDTIHWSDNTHHTNTAGLNLRGAGYQFNKKYFTADTKGSSIWLNQINAFDEYYHVHLYPGEGAHFEKSGHSTNQILHAHPIENVNQRKFSIRCVCDFDSLPKESN